MYTRKKKVEIDVKAYYKFDCDRFLLPFQVFIRNCSCSNLKYFMLSILFLLSNKQFSLHKFHILLFHKQAYIFICI